MAVRSRTCHLCGQPKFLYELWQVDSRGKDICYSCFPAWLKERHPHATPLEGHRPGKGS